MSCYFIALIDIHDPAGYERYLDGFDAAFAPYNGEVLAVDESPTTLEGHWPAKRTVVIRFPAEEDLLRWYRSPEYQRLASVRAGAATANIAVVRGVD
jgi:uncharacterized protein (DUF1330 family)